MIVVSEQWRTAYPGAVVGILAVSNTTNPAEHAELEKRKEALERQVRSEFADADRGTIKALPTIQAYDAYYRRFKKTYHVQLQLESVGLKGRSIPRVAGLVEAMFMAELKNLILTAGHDLALLRPPITLDVAQGTERYTMLNGQDQTLKPGDMFMADDEGVITSVIYGLDRRTCITPDTKGALFVVYAPAGIGERTVYHHLVDIYENVRVITPDVEALALNIYSAI